MFHGVTVCFSSKSAHFLPDISVHISSQGFLDIDLTDLRKGGANITGFQLVNNSDPTVSRVVQQWMEFDNKDTKMPKSGLKVLLFYCLNVCIAFRSRNNRITT